MKFQERIVLFSMRYGVTEFKRDMFRQGGKHEIHETWNSEKHGITLRVHIHQYGFLFVHLAKLCAKSPTQTNILFKFL